MVSDNPAYQQITVQRIELKENTAYHTVHPPAASPHYENIPQVGVVGEDKWATGRERALIMRMCLAYMFSLHYTLSLLYVSHNIFFTFPSSLVAVRFYVLIHNSVEYCVIGRIHTTKKSVYYI